MSDDETPLSNWKTCHLEFLLYASRDNFKTKHESNLNHDPKPNDKKKIREALDERIGLEEFEEEVYENCHFTTLSKTRVIRYLNSNIDIFTRGQLEDLNSSKYVSSLVYWLGEYNSGYSGYREAVSEIVLHSEFNRKTTSRQYGFKDINESKINRVRQEFEEIVSDEPSVVIECREVEENVWAIRVGKETPPRKVEEVDYDDPNNDTTHTEIQAITNNSLLIDLDSNNMRVSKDNTLENEVEEIQEFLEMKGISRSPLGPEKAFAVALNNSTTLNDLFKQLEDRIEYIVDYEYDAMIRGIDVPKVGSLSGEVVEDLRNYDVLYNKLEEECTFSGELNFELTVDLDGHKLYLDSGGVDVRKDSKSDLNIEEDVLYA